MAGFGMQIVLDDAQIRGLLARAKGVDRGDALHAAWDAIGVAQVSSTMKRFEAQRGPDGVAWEASQTAVKEGRKTLLKSHRLQLSMTHNVLSNGVEWGTNVIYAAVHQFGATIDIHGHNQTIYRKVSKSGELGHRFTTKRASNFATEHSVGAYQIHIPARPFVGIDKADGAEAENMLARHLEDFLLGGAASFMGSA